MKAKAPFELTEVTGQDGLVVRARGRFDGAAGEALERLMAARPCVLNMAAVDYISSSGVAALVKLSAKGRLRLASLAACVRDVISLAGMDRSLSIHADEEAPRA